MSLRIAIAGASGYAGGEMARLVADHPHFELGVLSAHSNGGRAISEVHPNLRGLGDSTFRSTDVSVLADHDVVVLALPHGHSATLGNELIEHNPDLTVVDLGADRRLVNKADWEKYYGGDFSSPWTYGMPELVAADGSKQRDALIGATRIAAPGCNASAITFALAPLVHAGLIDTSHVVSTLSVAPSGAGRALREDLLASERLSSAMAYAVGGTHRHIPEIVQSLGQASPGSTQMSLTMTPVLVPLSRGILAVTTAPVSPGVGIAEIDAAFDAVYGDERFIDYRPGSQPSTGSVLGSNAVSISAALDSSTGYVTVVSAIDNLVKGTAGAALQSLNIARGIDESAGLTAHGVAP